METDAALFHPMRLFRDVIAVVFFEKTADVVRIAVSEEGGGLVKMRSLGLHQLANRAKLRRVAIFHQSCSLGFLKHRAKMLG